MEYCLYYKPYGLEANTIFHKQMIKFNSIYLAMKEIKFLIVLLLGAIAFSPMFIVAATSWAQYGADELVVPLGWQIVAICGNVLPFGFLGILLRTVFASFQGRRKATYLLLTLFMIAIFVLLFGSCGVSIYAHNAPVVPYLIFATSMLCGVLIAWHDDCRFTK